MTREEMANACAHVAVGAVSEGDDFTGLLIAAAAELRKTCATCKWFLKNGRSGEGDGVCIATRYANFSVPEDGSGFCHRWAVKEPA